MYLQTHPATAPRRGIILLVVVALLTLFAVVGVTFVLYAQSRADVARLFRDSQQQVFGQGPNDAPQTLLAEFLSQLIYDVEDPVSANATTARNSALRGHSLARTMFGYNPSANNITPYSGIGRQRTTNPTNTVITVGTNNPNNTPWPPIPVTPPLSIDEFDLVNYMQFQADQIMVQGQLQPAVHDPERQTAAMGWRALSAGLNPFAGGFNVSYTYPDQNNMFLAAVKADGTVLCPSYHRPWITRKYFGQDFSLSPNANNPNDPMLSLWNGTTYIPNPNIPTNSWLKYLTLRPRPAEMGKGFPLPSNGGDVKNLQGTPGGNDSIWLDLGYPVETLPDSRRYKALFAPLVMDLDSRINLNNHGNLRGLIPTTPPNPPPSNYLPRTHASNQGWGPWEVNLAWVLNYLPTGYGTTSPLSAANMSATLTSTTASSFVAPVAGEWRNLLIGTTLAGTSIYGRYGHDNQPGAGTAGPASIGTNAAAPFGTAPVAGTSYGTLPPFYSLIDYEGADQTNNYAVSGPITPPVLPTAATSPLSPFPTFTPAYGNGAQGGTFGQDELSNHPLLFSFYQPANGGPTNYDNSPSGYNLSSVMSPPKPSLPDADLYALLYNLNDFNTLKTASMAGIYCPGNFTDNTMAIQAVTPLPASPQSGYLYLGNSTLGQRRRMLVTPRSFDLDMPAYTPWIWDRNSTAAGPNSPPPVSPYMLPGPGAGAYPTGAPIAFPSSFSTRPFSPPSTVTNPAGSDFGFPNQAPDQTWLTNATIANLGLTPNPATQGRLNLNQSLPQYPAPDLTTGTIAAANLPAFTAAQQARQQLASDVFARLQKVTGAADAAVVGPATANPPGTAPNIPQYDALRWLAQLAVNIVDYIDPDDIMTPFNWNPADTTAWVFGTELPRLVINEVYAEVVNNPTDPLTGGMATMPFNVNFSIELHNPFKSDPNLIDNGAARLVQDPTDGNSNAIYQIVIGTANGLASTPPNSNVRGDPDPANASYPSTPPFPITIGNGGPGSPSTGNYVPTPAVMGNTPPALIAGNGGYTVKPLANGAFSDVTVSNNGFFVVGPTVANAATGALTPTTPSVNLSALTYTVPASAANLTTIKTTIPPAVLLRRLACPWLAPNSTPGPTYNPYITVDYMENVPVQDGVTNTDAGANPTLIPIASRQSYGRTQPYANPPSNPLAAPRTDGPFAIQATSPPTPQQPPLPVSPSVTTFFQHNNPTPTVPLASTTTLQLPFFWLTHLDRQLVSPMELLEVSGFKPHELTHQFVQSGTTTVGDTSTPYFAPYSHRAPWFDNNARIYRLIELVKTGNRASGMIAGARVPGLININTLWDQESLLAIADPQPPVVNNTTTPSTTLVAPTSNSYVSQSGAKLNTPANIPANLYNPNYSVTNPNGVPYDTTTVFGQLMQSRSPTIQSVPQTGVPSGGYTDPAGTSIFFNSYVPGPNDQPFMGLSYGAYPMNDPQFPPNPNTPAGMTGVNTTLLRPLAMSATSVTAAGSATITTAAPTNGGIFANMYVTVDVGQNEEIVQVSAATSTTFTATFAKLHTAPFPVGRLFAPINNTAADTSLSLAYGNHPPHQQHQLLNRLFNNVTTRSNVFAVWLTVGFFEVLDDTKNPNVLGTEIGAPQGLSNSYRQHMFAIVDRSALVVGSPILGMSFTPVPTPGVIQIAVTPIPPTNSAPTIQSGSLITLDTGANQETVTVQSATAAGTTTTVTVQCAKTHQAGFNVLATLGTSSTLVPRPGLTQITIAPAPPATSAPTIQPGSLLMLDTGTNQETVLVLSSTSTGTNTTVTVHCAKAHQANSTTGFNVLATQPGNPGPQTSFDLNANRELVPYFTILD